MISQGKLEINCNSAYRFTYPTQIDAPGVLG